MALVPVTRPLSADVDGPGGGAVVRDRAAQLRQRFVARGVLPAARAQHMSLRREAISERRRGAALLGRGRCMPRPPCRLTRVSRIPQSPLSRVFGR